MDISVNTEGCNAFTGLLICWDLWPMYRVWIKTSCLHCPIECRDTLDSPLSKSVKSAFFLIVTNRSATGRCSFYFLQTHRDSLCIISHVRSSPFTHNLVSIPFIFRVRWTSVSYASVVFIPKPSFGPSSGWRHEHTGLSSSPAAAINSGNPCTFFLELPLV